MKRVLKLLLTIFVAFTFLNYINAEEEEANPCKQNKYISEAAVKACEEIYKHCWESEKLIGCDPDLSDKENAPLYNSVGKEGSYGSFTDTSTHLMGWGILPAFGIEFAVTATDDDVKLKKSQKLIDENGNILWVGCFGPSKMIYTNPNWFANLFQHWENIGYFYFKSVKYNAQKNKCEVDMQDIIPVEGSTYKRSGDAYIAMWEHKFDGNTPIGIDGATYKWKATENGDCPMFAGYSINTSWYTKYSNRYVFADNTNDVSNNEKKFWSKDKYEVVGGCTNFDSKAFEEAIKCYDSLYDENNYNCPDDLSQLGDELRNKLEGKYQACEEKYHKMFESEYLSKLHEIYENDIKEKINKTIEKCAYSKCNLSSTNMSKINEELNKPENSVCKDGCKINADETSNNDNAKCWQCNDGGSTVRYVWSANTPSGSCHPENKTKDECNTCYNCYMNVYKKAGLTDDEIKCLLDIKDEVDELKDELGEEVHEGLEEEQKRQEEESTNLFAEIFDSNVSNAKLLERPIDDTEATCKEVLGDNIVKIIKSSINILRVAGAIIAIVNAMVTLIPAVTSKDADGLKKAGRKCVIMGVILAIIGIFPTIMRLIGGIFGYDLSCIV